MSASDYLVGLAFFAGVVGAPVAAATVVIRRRLAHLRGVERTVACAILVTSGLIAVHVVPGIAGVLSRTTVLICALVVLVAAVFVRRKELPASAGSAPPGAEDEHLSLVIAAIAAAVVGLALLAVTWQNFSVPTTDIDSLDFHLPGVAAWIQSGSLWDVTHFLPYHQSAYYPANGDVVFLAAVLPWRSDVFIRLVNLPFLGVAALAVYSLASRLGAARSSAILTGAVFAALPVALTATTSGALTDIVFVGMFAGGVLFLVRHFSTGRGSDLVLAGLGLGVAFGTKWYGVSSVVITVVMWVGAGLAARRPWRLVAKHLAALSLLVAAAGGVWLVRNLAASGNPVYPQEVRLFGVTIFEAARDFGRECSGFTIAHYLGDFGILRRYVLPAFRSSFALPGMMLVGASVIALGAALLRRRTHDAVRRLEVPVVIAMSLCAIALAAAYVVTPYSAFGLEDEPLFVGSNTRYLLPALVVAACSGAWGIARLGRIKPVVAVFGLVAVLEGARRGLDVRPSTAVKVTLMVALAGAGGYSLVLAGRRFPAATRIVGTSFALVTLLAACYVGYVRQRDFFEGRYQGRDDAIGWLVRHAEDGWHIGIAGHWTPGIAPVYPAFGPRLGNRVEYVGAVVDGQMRPPERRRAFSAAVRRGRYDLIVIGKEPLPAVCDFPALRGREVSWASAEGFEQVAESRRLSVFRVSRD